MRVKPKKNLGQHFLKDENICKQISDSIKMKMSPVNLLEIGPGTGALSQHLMKEDYNLIAYEVDQEAINFLNVELPDLEIIEGDVLNENWSTLFDDSFTVIGNFPYNISSQILFKVYENRIKVEQLVGMFQKEVAERVTASPGNKKYGILSVLIQAFYDTEYLFTIGEEVFDPPPKVKSGVIRLIRNRIDSLPCDEVLFKRTVKVLFNQRRKMIRNTIKSLIGNHKIEHDFMIKRPEELSKDDFIQLTNMIESYVI